MNKWLASSMSLLVLACGGAAVAQSVPSPGQLAPRTGPPVQAPTPGTITIPEASPAAAPPGADRVEVTVGQIQVDGGYLPLDADTAAAVAGVTGKRVAVSRLYEVAAAIERYYASQGHFLTRVVIPPQQVRDGQTLRLQIVEGFIEQVDVAQLPGAVRDRISRVLAGLVGERRLKLGVLERKLLLAGDTPGTALRSTITPGGREGGVKLVVTAEHRPVTAELSVDNGYSKPFGRTVISTSAAINSVFGFGEQFYANVAGPPGKGWIAGGSARRLGAVGTLIPLGDDGLVLNVEGTWSTTRPRLPAGSLATESDYARYSVRFIYPLIRSRTENLTPRLTFDVINETQKAPEFGATLYEDRIRPLRIGATWTRSFDTDTTVSLGGDFSQGLPIFGSRGRRDATLDKPISRAFADDDFSKMEINARVVQRLPASFALDASFYGQYAFGGSLINAEQFTLGGPRRLSGYDVATFAGDSGWLARLELQYADAFNLTPLRGLVVPYLFAARGKVYVDKPTALERSSVGATSLGVGLRTNLAGIEPVGRDVEFQVEVARQYTDRGASHRDKWRVYIAGTLRF
ncbi:ShlB/FhaC/HecB family hemolysin secretion/activation protein [Reyranella sp. CPCC 100927]|uniref:ShlB/FhaC/HecB family hemolysin secretion/activation protein n=1 Tax=Reyranella sp. CPCC 100927 TaxID=2599616 RepID=UPI0015B42FFE|nr:ShlB/FhaC/HecB family hemolysin secretion/activation protein [Reyranella sp. CPCC 100927]